MFSVTVHSQSYCQLTCFSGINHTDHSRQCSDFSRPYIDILPKLNLRAPDSGLCCDHCPLARRGHSYVTRMPCVNEAMLPRPRLHARPMPLVWFFVSFEWILFSWLIFIGLLFHGFFFVVVPPSLLCSCVCFWFHGSFNCISFHKFSRQLSSFSLCSFGFSSALLALSATCLFYESLPQPWYNPLWLTGLNAPTC